jgi:curved DNA-binding protein CbpA
VQLRPNPLPETGGIEALTPPQAHDINRLASALDSQSYFEILQVSRSASAADIKRAFYRESRIYHPDRFFHLPDALAKTDINTIYKRITEAYYVLRDDGKRKKYLADLLGPDGASKLRFTEASEAEHKAEAKKAVADELGTNPKARQFFKTALADIDRQDWSAAERNLKTGLTYEPGNQKFREKLAEVQKKADEHRRVSGDAFKIR